MKGRIRLINVLWFHNRLIIPPLELTPREVVVMCCDGWCIYTFLDLLGSQRTELPVRGVGQEKGQFSCNKFITEQHNTFSTKDLLLTFLTRGKKCTFESEGNWSRHGAALRIPQPSPSGTISLIAGGVCRGVEVLLPIPVCTVW